MNLNFSTSSDSIETFISHWSSVYSYKDESKYETNIGKPFTPDSLLELFEWKNGSKLSKSKLNSVNKNYPLIFDGDLKQRYLNPKESGGAVWNIFYLHCLSPTMWPIFDQHVYRAMIYLQSGDIREISNSNTKKYIAYQKEYMPFFNSLPKHDGRKTDKALVTFGRFLKDVKKYLYHKK